MNDDQIRMTSDASLQRLYYNAMELMGYHIQDIVAELQRRKVKGPWEDWNLKEVKTNARTLPSE